VQSGQTISRFRMSMILTRNPDALAVLRSLPTATFAKPVRPHEGHFNSTLSLSRAGILEIMPES
jgi:hypothetical protein